MEARTGIVMVRILRPDLPILPIPFVNRAEVSSVVTRRLVPLHLRYHALTPQYDRGTHSG